MPQEQGKSIAEQFKQAHEQLSLADQALDEMTEEIESIVNEAMSEVSVEATYDLDNGSIHAHLPQEAIVSRLHERLDAPAFVRVEEGELVIRDAREEFDLGGIDIADPENERDRVKVIKEVIDEIDAKNDWGAPFERVVHLLEYVGLPEEVARQELEKLKQKGEVYEPRTDYIRAT